jgi:putative ABC transport system permease protein
MYSWTLSRDRELATLHAIGYPKRSIAVLVVLESVLLALIGGTLGLLVTLAANGHEFTMSQLHLVYAARATPLVIAETVACALIIGVGGAIVSCIQAIVRLAPGVLRG